MLKLKLQYFGHLMGRNDSLEKTLMLGKIKGRRRRGWQRMRCWMVSLTWWTWVWVSSGSWWWTGKPGLLQSMGAQSRVRFLHCKVNFFFSCFPRWLLWKQIHYMQSTPRSEELTSLLFLFKFLFSNLLFQTEQLNWEVIRKCQYLNKNTCYIFKCPKWIETQRKKICHICGW